MQRVLLRLCPRVPDCTIPSPHMSLTLAGPSLRPPRPPRPAPLAGRHRGHVPGKVPGRRDPLRRDKLQAIDTGHHLEQAQSQAERALRRHAREHAHRGFFMAFVNMQNLLLQSSWCGQMAHATRPPQDLQEGPLMAAFAPHRSPRRHVDELELDAHADPYNHGTGELAVGSRRSWTRSLSR